MPVVSTSDSESEFDELEYDSDSKVAKNNPTKVGHLGFWKH